MFTGIVETVGEVETFDRNDLGARIELAVPFASELAIGESVACNGCCLTVTAVDGKRVAFDLLEQTLKVTSLGDLKVGSVVNLERALALGDRLSGHLVQGHVDASSEILNWQREGDDHRFEVALPEAGQRYVIDKGSICVDGMSLTIAELRESSFVIWITPHTFQVTNLQQAAIGKRVNLEFDLLAKYLERLASDRV
ncbi:MAG: riboflavin synthase [Verrucomicrobiota bacterium]